jgi:methylmalonyl-CoA carboxyltransferase large subunit
MATEVEIEKKKTIGDKIAELAAQRAKLELGGGRERIERQHASGKLTARERHAIVSAAVGSRGCRADGCRPGT